jgi:predicted MPP superfamily phosphohydrolase
MHIKFSIVFLSLFLLLNVYIYKRFIVKSHFSSANKLYLKIFLLINYLFIIIYLLGRFVLDIPDLLYYFSSLSIGIIFFFFCITIAYDISSLIISKLDISLQRRSFMKKVFDYSAVVTLGFISSKATTNARDVEIIDVDITLQNLQKEYSIAQISDLHISKIIDKAYVRNVVNKVNSLNADVVVITGDLIDTDVSFAQESLKELIHLKSNYGTYFVVGNHEYFHDVQKCINAVKSVGIRVLENENIYIGVQNKGFNLAGVYDLFGYRLNFYEPDITKALKDKQNSPTVLLAHQPKFIHEIINGVDLVLSGHTHGGQINPFNNLVKLQQPYVKGLHKYNNKIQIYINQGTGFWGPSMRLGTVCEISHIHLK